MKKFIINMIIFYQKYISHIKKPCCRFFPTCSAYAIESIERFGVTKGIALSVFRMLRCNPFFKGGFDPVPQKTSKYR
ncbi:MAG: membrane protein insertion efficiency factor YidD [Oscillospiraceae bacterium]|nr:membrane protein insertion efficiency factor YidD [Oscillospiraceae bacterium]